MPIHTERLGAELEETLRLLERAQRERKAAQHKVKALTYRANYLRKKLGLAYPSPLAAIRSIRLGTLFTIGDVSALACCSYGSAAGVCRNLCARLRVERVSRGVYRRLPAKIR